LQGSRGAGGQRGRGTGEKEMLNNFSPLPHLLISQIFFDDNEVALPFF